MKLHTVKMLSALSLFLAPFFLNAKGVSLDATRIIYPQDAKSVSITVSNTDEQVNYLTRAYITDAQNKPSKAFELTPPVFKVASGSKQEVRIFSKTPELPTDRESLFYFHATMIAGQKEKTEGDGLNIGYDHVLKLFYRPSNLPMDSAQAREKLKFKIEGSSLKVNNDSPYYVNLAQIKINNQRLDVSLEKGNTTIAPYSSLSYPISSNMKQGTIVWRAITDLGGTDEFSAKLQ
ncbi:molecular chaperone [Providencia vermicola]|uniref:fimbrial biogenesis chaperone n=1 Tax=Providencia vermicola TaxID=333965 RepID=UPI001CEC431C|nr:molecular chaperone [Providencia vermicola]